MVAAAQEQFEKEDQAYRQNGRSHACCLIVYDGGHTYNILVSNNWFVKWL